MSLVKLYHPQGNNGVRILMTPDAYRAAMDRLAYYAVNYSYDGMDAGINPRITSGTFTFVSASNYTKPGAAERHYGTHEMMDCLVHVCAVTSVDDHIYVPFSNKPTDYDDDFRTGYGYCPGRFRVLAADCEMSYRNYDLTLELMEQGG